MGRLIGAGDGAEDRDRVCSCAHQDDQVGDICFQNAWVCVVYCLCAVGQEVFVGLRCGEGILAGWKG